MTQDISVGIIAVSCGVVCLIGLLKRRAQFLLYFFVRMILGAAGIFFMNYALEKQGILVSVGLNPISLLTTGSLGFSGFALLYLIVLSKFL
ncbi:MAG: pro-sigmaK processing inhibitor BofA family protein [Clostridiales bacterium]|nr:pro-sigmaK processing inhibitor BofA family protein [Clostridiales bacterium]